VPGEHFRKLYQRLAALLVNSALSRELEIAINDQDEMKRCSQALINKTNALGETGCSLKAAQSVRTQKCGAPKVNWFNGWIRLQKFSGTSGILQDPDLSTLIQNNNDDLFLELILPSHTQRIQDLLL
jgi:hypothetical protein